MYFDQFLRLPNDLPALEPFAGWPKDQSFAVDELLYYRVHPASWPEDFDDLDIDVFRMPDMSVNRDRYGGPELLLRAHTGWGVLQFRVKDIPQQQSFHGVISYRFKPIHEPLDNKYLYPHTVVAAFDKSNSRVQRPEYSEVVDLLWRERLRKRCKPRISADLTLYEDSLAE